MLVNFTKMHALGNDFVIVDEIRQRIKFNITEVKRIANRKFGVGCDQFLIIEPPLDPRCICNVRIFNQDGHEAAQCGNGMRAIAKYAFESGLTNKVVFEIQCQSGIYTAHIDDDNLITLTIPNLYINVEEHKTKLFNQDTKVYAIAVGNPHIVCMVNDLKEVKIAKLGKEIASNKQFVPNSNIGFMQIVNNNHIMLRVFENGVGETLACGSGACAAVIVGNRLGLLDAKTKVSFAHGNLSIEYIKEKNILNMQGPSTSVFFGTFRI
jgi:diaminopimelate epimerase